MIKNLGLSLNKIYFTRWKNPHFLFLSISTSYLINFDDHVAVYIVALFCGTGLPLASSRSAFSSHCPLSSRQRCWLTSAMLTIFSSEIVLGMLGLKPEVAGSGSKFANCCTMLPPTCCSFLSWALLVPLADRLSGHLDLGSKPARQALALWTKVRCL